MEDVLLKYAREGSLLIRPLVPGRGHLLERTAKEAIRFTLQNETIRNGWQGCQDPKARARVLAQSLKPMLREMAMSGLGLPI